VVDAAGLGDDPDPGAVCETEGGAPFPLASARRPVCDGEVVLALVDAQRLVIDLGRARKHPNIAQRRALRAMHATCGFSGCDVPFDRCELHHVRPWHHGGRTDLANLLPLCVAHHHLVHEGGWILAIDDQRVVTVTRPDRRASVPGGALQRAVAASNGHAPANADPTHHPRGTTRAAPTSGVPPG
jgi:hypothetical protein